MVAVQTAMTEFDRVANGLSVLESTYKGVVFDVQTKEGMKAAVLARRTIKAPRVEIEKVRKAAKAPILELGRKLDSEAARITAALEALEKPIDLQITTEEDRLHNEAVAKAAAETQRVAALEARLEALQLMPFDAQGLTSAQAQACLDEAKALKIGEDWQEYAEKAERSKISVVAALEGMVAAAVAKEAEAARIIAERAELEQLRAKQAENDRVERERQAVEAAKVAAEQKAEAERLAAERAAAKAEYDRVAAEQAAEQDKLNAERLAFAKEQELVRQEQAERIRIDAVNFRAHQEHLTPRQAALLRSDSDAQPNTDVYSLPLPSGYAKNKEALKPIDEDKERADFEAWAKDELLDLERIASDGLGIGGQGQYTDETTELVWRAVLWRAKRG